MQFTFCGELKRSGLISAHEKEVVFVIKAEKSSLWNGRNQSVANIKALEGSIKIIIEMHANALSFDGYGAGV